MIKLTWKPALGGYEARSLAGDLYRVAQLSATVWITAVNGVELGGWRSTKERAMATAQANYDLKVRRASGKRYYIRQYRVNGAHLWALYTFHPQHEDRPPMSRKPITVAPTIARLLRTVRRQARRKQTLDAREEIPKEFQRKLTRQRKPG